MYVNRRNPLAWLMALCLVGSAVARIVIACLKGSGDSLQVWSQIVLPVAATLLFVLIVLMDGKERFYKTTIPVALMAIYYAIRPHEIITNPIIRGMYYTCLVFYCLVYLIVSCGRLRYPWLLFFLFAGALASVGYSHWFLLNQGNAQIVYYVLPEYLLFLGATVLTLGIRVHTDGAYHPTWGDRPDGRRLRSLSPMDQVSPYLMVNRNGASNTYEEALEITHVDRYIRKKRKEGLTNFGITHVLLACYVRTLCKYPGLNRFLSGQKVYSRGDDIQYCMTIKKEMSTKSSDTVIKVHLKTTDTADDVYRKLQAAVDEVKHSSEDSNFDNTAAAFTLIPGVFLKFVVWLLRTMDYFGLVPRFLLEISPFHGSLYFTSMGSLGIAPVYHHLYDFGNLPVFGAFGCKRRALQVQEDGTVVQRKYVDMKFTLDERIADGYYYAAFFKHFKRVIAHPEILDEPPDEVIPDID